MAPNNAAIINPNNTPITNAINIFISKYGNHSIELIHPYFNLADCQYEKRDFSSALESISKAIDIIETAYGSDSYGLTAYILHRVQIFSIPFSILGILIAAIYDYIIGVRHLETKEKGKALMIMFITLGVICQVLPLVFTIVVKFGRE